MSFPLVLGHVASLCLLAYLWIYSALNQGRPGSRSLITLFSLLVLWAASRFAGALVPDDLKLLFWNIGEIGVFCVPAALWSFVRSYTGKIEGHARRERWGVIVLASLGILSVLLLMTDSWHHLMRQTAQVLRGPEGSSLLIRTSTLGLVFVSLNYLVMFASVVQLVLFAVRNGGLVRVQLSLFILAIMVTIGYALYRQFGGTVNIPISWLFTLSGLLLAIGAYRYDFLRVTPIARNLAFDILEEGIVICSSNGRVIDLNAAAHSLLIPNGGSLDEAGRVLDAGIPDRRMPHLPGTTRQAEFQLEGSEGSRTLHLVSYPVTTDRDLVLGSVSVLRDVTALRRQNAILVEKAERDGLTGLFNRATFVDRVERRLLPGGAFVLLVFDIDDFKGINDFYGHLMGDEVLKGVCRRVGADLREGDVFGRLGGDEFAVFLNNLDQAQVPALAERIRSGVEGLGILPVPVTLSIGFVVRPARSFAELYHLADQALYEAKRQGKNRVSAF